MRNLPLLLAILFIAIALPVLAEVIDSKCAQIAAERDRCKDDKTKELDKCNDECNSKLQQCPNPTGAYIALSLLFVLFFVLFVLVMVDAFVLNKLFKRAKGGSDG